jgi:hypothetical protein
VSGPPGPPGVTPEEVDVLRRLSQEYRDDADHIGILLQQLDSDIKDLSKRVSMLEQRVFKPRKH